MIKAVVLDIGGVVLGYVPARTSTAGGRRAGWRRDRSTSGCGACRRRRRPKSAPSRSSSSGRRSPTRWDSTPPRLRSSDGVLGRGRIAKPDERVYRHTLDALGVEPSETFFVDDRLENVEAARALGIHALCSADPDHLLAEAPAILERLG